MELMSGKQDDLPMPHPSFDSTASRNAWVVYQLRKKGTSLSKLSKQNGLGRTVVAWGLHKPYPRVERIIAEAVGLNVEELFPERYLDGVRIDRRKVSHA